MKKFVSKFFTCLLVVVTVASMMCSSAFATSGGKSTCAQKGCHRAQDWGSIYCSYHRPKTTSYNYFKKRRSAKPLLPTVLRPRAVTPVPAAKSTIAPRAAAIVSRTPVLSTVLIIVPRPLPTTTSRSKKNTRKPPAAIILKRRVLPRTVILPAAITLLANRIVPMMTAMTPSMMMTITMKTATIVIPITLTALMMQWMNSIGNRESHHEYSNNFI